jgi:hypothetical protein
MAAAKVAKKSISDDAVSKATGKDWNAWFRMLDKAGAREMTHPRIVSIAGEHGASPWWRQMVTVEYERARGLRVKHETTQGFSVTASKTIAAPVGAVYSAWMTPAARRRWLEDPDLAIRAPHENKSLRFTWKDGTSVAVGFTTKGERKSQLAVEHGKLESAASAARMKTYWKRQLEALHDLLCDTHNRHE